MNDGGFSSKRFVERYERLKKKAEGSVATETPRDVTARLVEELSKESPLDVPVLMQRAGVGVLEAGPVLSKLRELGAIEVQGSSSGELVSLTDRGRELFSLFLS